MGEKQSKSASSKDTGHVKAVKHDPCSCGEESEFWFLIDRVNLFTITSAKELYRRLVEKLSDLKDKILGVRVENDRHSCERHEDQVFVYLKDYEPTKDASNRMNLQMLGRHQINTSCVPPRTKNRDTENEDSDDGLQKASFEISLAPRCTQNFTVKGVQLYHLWGWWSHLPQKYGGHALLDVFQL